MATADPIPTHSDDADRWEGVERPYDAEHVEKLRGSLPVEHTLAKHGAEKLWELLHERDYIAALGASTGNQAVQQVRAGLEAIYLSGWQVAADANLAGQMYPDQGLYPVNSVPEVVRAHQRGAPARRPDRPRRGQGRHRLVRADRRRRRGGLRRSPQRLRAHQGDDRGRRRGRALRGPARVGEEVRPHGRQGAAADRVGDPQPRRRPARRRRLRHADADRRPHRRRGRRHGHLATPTSATTSSSPASAPRRASSAPRPGIDQAIARGARLRALRRPRLVRDLRARPRRRPSASPRRVHDALPRQAARLQLLAVVQLEGASSPTTRSAEFQERAGRAGLPSSSSSRWRASTRSTTRCSSSPAATASAA